MVFPEIYLLLLPEVFAVESLIRVVVGFSEIVAVEIFRAVLTVAIDLFVGLGMFLVRTVFFGFWLLVRLVQPVVSFGAQMPVNFF